MLVIPFLDSYIYVYMYGAGIKPIGPIAGN